MPQVSKKDLTVWTLVCISNSLLFKKVLGQELHLNRPEFCGEKLVRI